MSFRQFYHRFRGMKVRTQSPGRDRAYSLPLNSFNCFTMSRAIFGICLAVIVSICGLAGYAQTLTTNQTVTTDGGIPLPSTNPPPLILTNPPPSAVPQFPAFSPQPTADEIAKVRVFEEPVIPTGEGFPSQDENNALASALMAFANRTNSDDFSALTDYLQNAPNEHWYPSVLFNLGLEYYNTGYYSRALGAWEEAWFWLADEGDGPSKQLADRAIGELAKMHARIGDFKRLQQIFEEIQNRPITGSATALISGSRQALWLMQNRSEIAFRCGPLALKSICGLLNPPVDVNEIVENSASTQQGFSLSQLEQLSQQLQLNFQMARRQPGAAMLLPCVVHWGVGHYAAVLSQAGSRYFVVDPTFGQSRWISQAALDSEASGYFLVPPGPLTNGWQTVSDAEGQTVWGKGVTGASDPNDTAPYDQMADPECDSHGMATYNVHLMLVSLHIEDTPISFTPPRGPPIRLTVTYNQEEANQPANFTYSNFGQLWTCNWISYLTDNSTNNAADVNFYVDGGGTEVFTYTNSGFNIQWRNQASLARLSSSSYRMAFPDGSVRYFSQPDGTVGSSRKVFLTQVVDPTGYTNVLNYDSLLRLVSVTDPQANLTNLTFFYNSNPLAGNGYTIQQVTDRYGRSATFGYDYFLLQLQSITDVLGLTSQVSYANDGSDFVTQLQTPYGTSTFSGDDDGAVRWLEATDPQGNTSRVEFNQSENIGIPNSEPGPLVPRGLFTRNYIMFGRNTFYWDKAAFAQAPGDYSQARLYHWLHNADLASAEGALESVKEPMENRVWFNYPGQSPGSSGATIYGSLNQPSSIGRVLDDGDTQLFQYSRNSLGKVTNAIDPVGRSFTFDYTTNQIDLLQVRQTTGTNNQLVASFTYNSQHLPMTAIDASGQTTKYSYNTYGQVTGITNALSQVTSFNYSTSGNLLSILGPTNNDTTSFGYDAFDRVKAMTNADGYYITVAYDAFDRPVTKTYPDGTTETTSYKFLDPQTYTDRGGKVTQFVFDSLRHLTQITEATNWNTYFAWCGCGDLSGMTDPLGHVTQWFHDIQGRITVKQYDDGRRVSYGYENTTSRIKSFTNERGQTRTYQYYDDGNLESVVYANSNITPTLIFTYDPNFNRLTQVLDGSGTNSFTYNPITSPAALGAGRLSRIRYGNIYDAMSYSYDALGRVAIETLTNADISPSGPIGSLVYGATYCRDTLGRIVSINASGFGTFTYNYDGVSSRLASVLYPAPVWYVQTAAYDYYGISGDFRLKDITNNSSEGLLSRFAYAYDQSGRITNWVQTAGSGAPQTNRLQYDALGQLTNVIATSPGSSATNAYAYDAASNRIREQNAANTWRAWYNPLNQLQGKDQGFSPASRTYQWDEENRLVSVATGSSSARLVYDAFGRVASVIQMQGANVVFTNNLVWSLGKLVEQGFFKTNNSLTCNWYYPHGIASGYDGFQEGLYISYDHLGSVRELTQFISTPPGSGVPIEMRYGYDPYGRQSVIANINSFGVPFGFGDYFGIPGQNLDLAMYRAYDPDLGRWLSRDPIGESGGANLYAFAGNDPINNVDIDGLCPQRGFAGGLGQFRDPNSGQTRDAQGPVQDQLNPLNPINFEGANSPSAWAAENMVRFSRVGGADGDFLAPNEETLQAALRDPAMYGTRLTTTPIFNSALDPMGQVTGRGLNASVKIGPNAFGSRADLIQTIIHEETHIRLDLRAAQNSQRAIGIQSSLGSEESYVEGVAQRYWRMYGGR
jgi:RHS repeat-associated protein